MPRPACSRYLYIAIIEVEHIRHKWRILAAGRYIRQVYNACGIVLYIYQNTTALKINNKKVTNF